MKILKVCSLFILICSYVNAQYKPVPEPEYVGNFYYLDSAEVKPLEKQKTTTETKVGIGKAFIPIVGAFVTKAKSKNVVTGYRSTVRILRKERLQFLVRVNDTGIDPFEIINVFSLEKNINKNNRSVLLGSYSIASGMKTGNDNGFIQFTATKYGESSFLVELKNLIPGEYAMTVEGRRDVFNMFGID